MKPRPWTPKEENLLRKLNGKYPREYIAQKLHRTLITIEARLTLLKLCPRKFWTPEEHKRLKKYYLNHTADQCAIKLGRSVFSIRQQVNKKHYRHSKRFDEKLKKMFIRIITEAGKPYRIKKGQVIYRMPKGTHTSPETEFKRGHIPAGTFYNGAIRIRLEKTGHADRKRLMKYIRIKKGRWIYLKNYIWEKHFGKIPKGMLVALKNPRDPLNCSIRNLCLITKAASIRRTQETDEYIAAHLSYQVGLPVGSYDHKLYQEMLKQPELLNLKRKELELRRKIRNAK